MDVKPLITELKACVARSWTTGWRREAQRVRRGVRRRSRCRRAGGDPPERAGAGHRLDGRHPAVGGSSPTAPRRSATAPASCWPASCSPGRPAPGCCTPTRTRATSACADDGRLGVLDFGTVNRLPDGLPAPIGPLLRLAARRRCRGRYAGLQDGGLRQTRRRAGRRGGAGLPRADHRARPGRGVPLHPGLDAQPGGPDRRSALPGVHTGHELNLPPAYLLIHRVTASAIGVLCQLEAAGPWRGELEHWLPGFPEPRRPRKRRT